MPYANERRMQLLISTSTQAITALLAAPGSGKRYAIDYLNIIASGGANTVTFTGNIAAPLGLANTQQFTADNAMQDPEGVFHCDDNQAFSITLANATAVVGWINYRIINS